MFVKLTPSLCANAVEVQIVSKNAALHFANVFACIIKTPSLMTHYNKTRTTKKLSNSIKCEQTR